MCAERGVVSGHELCVQRGVVSGHELCVLKEALSAVMYSVCAETNVNSAVMNYVCRDRC